MAKQTGEIGDVGIGPGWPAVAFLVLLVPWGLVAIVAGTCVVVRNAIAVLLLRTNVLIWSERGEGLLMGGRWGGRGWGDCFLGCCMIDYS